MIEKQVTFDTVVAHLRKQGKRAFENGRGCRYRTHDGLQCAAGCLIPDEKYSPELEGTTVMACTPQGMQATGVGMLITELGHDVNFVQSLQALHDGVLSFEWEEAFEKLAKTQNLTYTPLVSA